MMKPYSAQNHLPAAGILLLIPGSIMLGIGLGALAFFISNFIYLVFVFALVVGVAAMLAYYKLLQFARVRHTLIGALFGLITGLCVAGSFYGVPYLVFRNEFVNDAQKKYQVNAQIASEGFDKILVQETGSAGLLGFMKIRAREGDSYTNYLMVNSVPVNTFSFTIKSTWAWVYWIVEILFMVIPTTLIGFNVGRRAFSRSANDWYNPLPKPTGYAGLESKEKLMGLLQANDLQGIPELIVPEENLTHPMLEFYEQRANNKKGDILFSLKQTYRTSPTKIKRYVLSQWEIHPQEYEPFADAVRQKTTE